MSSLEPLLRRQVLDEVDAQTTWQGLLQLLQRTQDESILHVLEALARADTRVDILGLDFPKRGRKKLVGLMPIILKALQLWPTFARVSFGSTRMEAADLDVFLAKGFPASLVEVRFVGEPGLADQLCERLGKALSARGNNPFPTLVIDDCNVTVAGLSSLCSALEANPWCLTTLVLGDNSMGKDGLERLAELLRSNVSRLEEIVLELYNFREGGLEAFLDALSANKWLKSVALHNTSPFEENDAKLIQGVLTRARASEQSPKPWTKEESEREENVELKRVVFFKSVCANPTCGVGCYKTFRCGGSCNGRLRFCSVPCLLSCWTEHHGRDGCESVPSKNT